MRNFWFFHFHDSFRSPDLPRAGARGREISMNYYVLTLFPEMVREGLDTSILGRAADRGYISLEAVNIRDYTLNRHGKVDDYPYGGGAGMLMQAQPVYDAWRAVTERIREKDLRPGGKNSSRTEPESEEKRPKAAVRMIYVTPQGRVFDQELARELAREENLIFLCGHYEGIDERVLDEIVTDQISIGDYVLTGGELPAMVMIDAISRLVPGVLKNEESAEYESFHENLLEYPQYTRPEEWRGVRVPDVLLSGDHARVDRWRLEQSEERTRLRRPELYARYAGRQNALAYLEKDRLGHMDMLEVIRRNQADILYADEDGVLLHDIPSGAWMLSAVDGDMGDRLLSLIPRGEADPLFETHQTFIRDSICRRFHPQHVNECRQAVYTRKQPVEEPDHLDLRPLDEGDLDRVRAAYHAVDSEEYLRERLRSGSMLGAFVDGGLVAFIGMHAEGSMGMLEVSADHRRKGIGEALERRMLNRILQRGQVPFCQIFVGNEASMALQKKLGLRMAHGKIYWIY